MITADLRPAKAPEGNILFVLILFLLPFGLHLATICPNGYWRDATEFQTIAFQLGIAHPAGSPLYALIAKLFTFLPIGSIAFKVNCVSAFFAGMLIVVTFLCIQECLYLLFPKSTNRTPLLLGAFLAACFYAVSNSLWYSSIVAEVYTLQNCLIALIALSLLRGLRFQSKPYMALACFLFGLSTGAHIIMILYIPALFIFYLLIFRKTLSFQDLMSFTALVILGASIYLYLPVRSTTDPYYDWGNPETVENFIVHVTDRKDAKRHFSFSLEDLKPQIVQYGRYYQEDFYYYGIVLGIMGLVIFFRKNKRLLVALGLFFFSQWWFFIRYWPWSSAFIPTFVFFTILIGVGLGWLLKFIIHGTHDQQSPRKARTVAATILMLLLVAQIVITGSINKSDRDRSDYWTKHALCTYIFDTIAFNGVFLDTLYYFGTSYLQQCENYRPDIVNLFLSDLISPEVFNVITQKRYPSITVPATSVPDELGPQLISANIAHRPFFWDPTSKSNYLIQNNVSPHGLILRVTPSPQAWNAEETEKHLDTLTTFLETANESISRWNDAEEIFLYTMIFQNFGQLFFNKQDYNAAVAYLEAADALRPDQPEVLSSFGAIHAIHGNYQQAESYFQRSLAVDPHNSKTLRNLAQLYRDTGRTAGALSIYEKILTLNPQDRKTYYLVGSLLASIDKRMEAQEAFQLVINLSDEEDALTRQAKKKLHTLDASP